MAYGRSRAITDALILLSGCPDFIVSPVYNNVDSSNLYFNNTVVQCMCICIELLGGENARGNRVL